MRFSRNDGVKLNVLQPSRLSRQRLVFMISDQFSFFGSDRRSPIAQRSTVLLQLLFNRLFRAGSQGAAPDGGIRTAAHLRLRNAISLAMAN